jgi:alpha-beta hydrolase superfamily lysophospholipase|uniref:Secretory lipase n=2 Tax=Phyllobacteriaceae TaxID=69277 RepID=Q11IF4_CHESB
MAKCLALMLGQDLAEGNMERNAIKLIGSLILMAAAVLTAGWLVEPSQPGSFYRIEEEIKGAPGDILRVAPFPGPVANGARAWRVLYVSTGLSGEPIAVSGVIAAPEEKAPAEGRPVVAWAHGTTGVTSRCAPSLRADFFQHVPGVTELLRKGYVVAATDYPGLGTPSPHPYLVGESEGRAVLDAVRAAAKVESAGTSKRFAAWGHSQGGHAALFAGQIAADYAPELEIAGVAVAAPATNLAELVDDDLPSKAGKVLTALAMWSWNKVFDAPLSPLLDPEAIAAIDRIAADCMEDVLQGLVLAEREKAIDGNFIHGDLTQTEPWKRLLEENTPDAGKADAPLFMAQGTADTIVRPQVTRDFAERACRSGRPVRFIAGPGLDHMGILAGATADVVEWISDRLAGSPAPSDCADLPTVRY